MPALLFLSGSGSTNGTKAVAMVAMARKVLLGAAVNRRYIKIAKNNQQAGAWGWRGSAESSGGGCARPGEGNLEIFSLARGARLRSPRV